MTRAEQFVERMIDEQLHSEDNVPNDVKRIIAETLKYAKDLHDTYCPSTANAFTVRLEQSIKATEVE